MKKDTIYIDIEDDITAIIDKIGKSNSKIVALVPPKRSTVFNSVVNMKLLLKTAQEQDKKVVLVTSEQSLLSLAAGTGMYTTPNLHSKPAVPEAGDAPSMPDDVIDGEELDMSAPVGELDKLQQANAEALEGIPPSAGTTTKKAGAGFKAPKIKIPSFESFRSRLLLIGGGALLLLLGWWWAFFVAPRASVAIEAQTTRVDVAFEFNADTATKADDLTKNRFVATKVEIKRSVTEPFTATGTKNVGDKASGQMTIQNCQTSVDGDVVVPAGTIFTSPSGLKFESLEEASLPGGTFTPNCTTPGEATVTVRGVEPGDKYNLANGTIYDIDGVGSDVSGYGGQMSGGTNKEVKVVAQKDIDDAKKRLEDKDRTGVLSELKEQFDAEDVVAVNETYFASLGKVTSAPAVGDEANSGNVSSEVVFTLLGIKRDTLKNAVENILNARITGGDQSIYDNGLGNLIFSLIKKTSVTNYDLSLRTEGFIGPKLDTVGLAKEISGKRFSEALNTIEGRPGVVKVNINLEPFWVFSLPKAEKIDIRLEVSGAGG